jgi:hypothetical protein
MKNGLYLRTKRDLRKTQAWLSGYSILAQRQHVNRNSKSRSNNFIF